MRRDPEREPDDRDSPPRGPVRRILWRRRAWGWITVLGLGGYLALGTTLLVEGTTPGGVGQGAGPAVSAVEWLAVPVGAGALGALAESRLLRRHRPAGCASLPPRSSPAWWLAVLAGLGMALGLLVLPTWDLPEAVNAWGYVTGAEPSATFVARYPYQECSTDDSGDQTCSWYTDGYLVPGQKHAVWHGYVPAGQARQVRGLLWDWLSGDRLINDAGAAIGEIVFGLFAGLVLVASLFVGWLTVALAVNLARDRVE